MSLLSLGQQHQTAILAREAQAAKQITADWHTAYSRVLARLHWLFAQMQQAEVSGQDLDLAWLLEANRLQQALSQVQTEMQSFNQQGQSVVQAQVSQAQLLGAQDGLSLIRQPLGAQFGRPMPQAQQILAGRGASNASIANLFSRMDKPTIIAVRRALLLGLSLGKGPREIARDIQQPLTKPLKGALTIARTETMNAYRSGALSIYQANSDVLHGWTWLAESDACPFCLSMNGSHHTLSESMDTHPNCRCTQLPDTKSYDEILAA